MKAKLFEIVDFTITEVTRIFGNKWSRALYTLLNKGKLDDYIWWDISVRVFLMLEPPNQIQFAQNF